MNALLALLAPFALLVPALAGSADLPDPRPAAAPPAGQAVDPAADEVVGQVRIERRITVRIAPPGPSLRQSMVAQAAPLALPKLKERKIGKCLPVAAISAVQPDAKGKLLLFMRDRRLVSATLEKACSARDFYAGFYLERTADGMLCVDRDKLHSRAGATCEVSRMRQLVAKD
jgi:hypothetical protein